MESLKDLSKSDKAKIDLNDGSFEDVEPLEDYVLVSVTSKENVAKTKSGLLVVKDEQEATVPCLEVMRISKGLENSGYDLKSGDIIEMVDIYKLTYFHGPNMEVLSLIDKKNIAAVHRKKLDTNK